MANQNNKSNWISPLVGLIALALIVWGITAFVENYQKPLAVSTNGEKIMGVQAPTEIIQYQGIEGKTALQILKEQHQVETETYDFGELVTAIDGKKSGDGQYWAFYINGELASVGAGEYQTQSSDLIEWRLESL